MEKEEKRNFTPPKFHLENIPSPTVNHFAKQPSKIEEASDNYAEITMNVEKAKSLN